MSSILNMALTGMPTVIVNTGVINTDTGTLLFFGPVSWTNGTASLIIDEPIGTTLEYYAINSTRGGVHRGVTE